MQSLIFFIYSPLLLIFRYVHRYPRGYMSRCIYLTVFDVFFISWNAHIKYYGRLILLVFFVLYVKEPCRSDGYLKMTIFPYLQTFFLLFLQALKILLLQAVCFFTIGRLLTRPGNLSRVSGHNSIDNINDHVTTQFDL